MSSPFCRIAVLAALTCAIVAGSGTSGARAAALGAWQHLASPSAGGLVQRADIFRDCQNIRACWRNRSGRRVCGLAERCRECRYVRRCTKADGCAWREVCRWGPAVPPVAQPRPPR